MHPMTKYMNKNIFVFTFYTNCAKLHKYGCNNKKNCGEKSNGLLNIIFCTILFTRIYYMGNQTAKHLSL